MTPYYKDPDFYLCMSFLGWLIGIPISFGYLLASIGPNPFAAFFGWPLMPLGRVGFLIAGAA